MAKMSFEEYLQARAEYADYLKTEEGITYLPLYMTPLL